MPFKCIFDHFLSFIGLFNQNLKKTPKLWPDLIFKTRMISQSFTAHLAVILSKRSTTFSPRWRFELDVHCNVPPQPGKFQNKVLRIPDLDLHLQHAPYLHLGSSPGSGGPPPSHQQLEDGLQTCAQVPTPGPPTNVWFCHFWS